MPCDRRDAAPRIDKIQFEAHCNVANAMHFAFLEVLNAVAVAVKTLIQSHGVKARQGRVRMTLSLMKQGRREAEELETTQRPNHNPNKV